MESFIIMTPPRTTMPTTNCGVERVREKNVLFTRAIHLLYRLLTKPISERVRYVQNIIIAGEKTREITKSDSLYSECE